uniref:Uncharacterized protein n=1 Tax=Photinus pyralis TaxID=7054 RepID=A0A1Y1L0A9_PHOPY
MFNSRGLGMVVCHAAVSRALATTSTGIKSAVKRGSQMPLLSAPRPNSITTPATPVTLSIQPGNGSRHDGETTKTGLVTHKYSPKRYVPMDGRRIAVAGNEPSDFAMHFSPSCFENV